MARYAIGDIQGCYTEFMLLLQKINFTLGADTLYLVGDLVNRGPQSLEVIQWIYKHQDHVITVLGNHDIYLLGRFAKVIAPSKDDTISDILNHTDSHKIIDWLRRSPLIYQDEKHLLVHAGIYPKLDLQILLALNDEISDHLQSDSYAEFIENIYGNKPNQWQEELSPIKKMKFAINSCTRMRFLQNDSFALDYKYKGDFNNTPENLTPWFKVDFDQSINKKIIFGHWAALGFYHHPRFISLDTGCVWGNKLTAINLDSFDLFQVDAQH